MATDLLSNLLADKKFTKRLWTTIHVVTGIFAGSIPVVSYANAKGLNINLPLLWAFAYFVIGALLGFLFGVPKIITNEPTNSTGGEQRVRAEENTNFTDISNWLAKLLIGAGLVQLKEVPKFILRVSKYMAKGIRGTGANINDIETIDNITLFSAAIILYFLTWGFISGYLVMKLVLTEEFLNSYNQGSNNPQAVASIPKK